MAKPLRFRENHTGQHRRSNFKKLGKKSKFSYRLIDFENRFFHTDQLIWNTKCNFHIYQAGLMLSGDFSTAYTAISILSKEVESITLIRGREIVDTFYLSPMHLLSKFGVSNHISRHFRFHPTEYRISETRIIIEAHEHRLELITGGYRFEKLERRFKRMGYGHKLKTIRRPSLNLMDYHVEVPDVPFLK